MMERTCFYCNQSMPAGTHPRRKYCNDQCKRAAFQLGSDGATLSNREAVDCLHCEGNFTRHIKDTWHEYCSNICQALHDPACDNGKQCNFPGCTKKREAGKFCTSHYSLASRKFTKKFTRTCSQCGDEFGAARKQTTEATFCSEPCRMTYMTVECGEKRAESFRRTHYARYSNELVPYVKPRRKLKPPVEVKGKGTWKSCTCRICASPYITKNIDVTCSEECAETYRREVARIHKMTRRARMKQAFVEPVNPRIVYARSDYICHLCGEPLRMDLTAPEWLAPTVDHVIPLAKGGKHSYRNTKAAHFICNSRKGDREEVVMFG